MADILFSGCRSGRYPLEYARKHPDEHIFVHAYDSYQARKVCEDNGRRRHNVEVICAAGLPDGAVYSEAFYHATSKLVSAELELDTRSCSQMLAICAMEIVRWPTSQGEQH